MNPAFASLPSLGEVLAVAYRYKAALVLSFVLPVAASIALAFWLTPKFEASGLLLVNIGREYMPHPEIGDATQSAPSTSMKATIDTEVQIASSADVLRDVVRSMTVKRLYPRLAADPPRGLPLEDAALRALSQDFSATPVKLTNVIELALRNPDRAVAKEALRVLLDRFAAMHIKAFSQDRVPVLERQARDDEERLRELQQARTGYVVRHGLYSVGEQRSLLVAQRGKDGEALRDSEQRKASIEAQLVAVRAELERQPEMITLQSLSQDSPGAQDVMKRERDLVAKRQELAARGYGAHSPLILGVEGELASVRQSLAETHARSTSVTTGANPVANSLRAQLATLGTDLAPLAGTIAALRGNLVVYEGQLRQLAQDDIALRDYDRRIEDLVAAAEVTRKRLADARYTADLDRAGVVSVKEVQSPVASDRPVWPNKRLIAAAGVVAGSMTTAFALLLLLTFGNHCLTTETAERLLGTPVLAVLPDVSGRRMRLPALGAKALGAGRVGA